MAKKLTINLPKHRLAIREAGGESQVELSLMSQDYNPHVMPTLIGMGVDSTARNIFTQLNDMGAGISQPFACYLSACLYEKEENQRNDLSDQYEYRGYSPYYNPATLVKTENDEPIASNLNLKNLLMIDGKPIPNFPDIYISDEGCNPQHLINEHQGKRIAIIDLMPDTIASRWHQKLGLQKYSVAFHESGEGLRAMSIPNTQSIIYDALRENHGKTRNLIDSTNDNLFDSFQEILVAIKMLLDQPEQPEVITFKCLEGKDRSPSFAFFYTIAWLYKHHDIELSADDYNNLKFMISIQVGPVSPLEFVEKVKNQLFENNASALFQNIKECINPHVNTHQAPMLAAQINSNEQQIQALIDIGMTIADALKTLDMPEVKKPEQAGESLSASTDSRDINKDKTPSPYPAMHSSQPADYDSHVLDMSDDELARQIAAFDSFKQQEHSFQDTALNTGNQRQLPPTQPPASLLSDDDELSQADLAAIYEQPAQPLSGDGKTYYPQQQSEPTEEEVVAQFMRSYKPGYFSKIKANSTLKEIIENAIRPKQGTFSTVFSSSAETDSFKICKALGWLKKVNGEAALEEKAPLCVKAVYSDIMTKILQRKAPM